MKRKRLWFFSTPETEKGTRLNKKNRPTKSTFKDLLDSIPFFNEASSIGTEEQPGLFQRISLTNLKNRVAGGFALMAAQLPEVKVYSDQDDTAEEAAYGIGITKKDVEERENLYIKLRTDTLEEVSFASESDLQVVLSKPNAVSKKERTIRMPLLSFIANFFNVEPVTSNIISTSFDPPIAFKLGTTLPALSMFLPKLNGITQNITDINHVIFVSNGITYTAELVSGKVMIDITAITDNFANLVVTYNDPVSGNVYTGKLYAVYIDTTDGVVGDDPDPLTYTIEANPSPLIVSVDDSNNAAADTFTLVKVINSNGVYKNVAPADLDITLVNGTFTASVYDPQTVKVLINTLTASSNLVINSASTSSYPGISTSVSLTRLVETNLNLALMSPTPLIVQVDSDGNVQADGIMGIQLLDSGVRVPVVLSDFKHITIVEQGFEYNFVQSGDYVRVEVTLYHPSSPDYQLSFLHIPTGLSITFTVTPEIVVNVQL